ncbi:hypothetical protein HDV00_005136 [Rhizophlyctis rosea]|nr:hypothetical protein HDV00_005136 [Rhizophlyctis rosea]
MVCGQFDPDNPHLKSLIRHFLSDMSNWFPDKLLHTGADEINDAAWNFPNSTSDPAIFHSFSKKVANFQSFIHETVTKDLKKKWAIWDESVAPRGKGYGLSKKDVEEGGWSVPTDTVIFNWEFPVGKSADVDANSIAGEGYRQVVAFADRYYLDCGPQQWWCADKSSGRPLIHDWKSIYKFDPVEGIHNPETVIGAEVGTDPKLLPTHPPAALWTEAIKCYILDKWLWPRPAALGERLWSPSSTLHTTQTDKRINLFKERLKTLYGIESHALDYEGYLPVQYRVEWCDGYEKDEEVMRAQRGWRNWYYWDVGKPVGKGRGDRWEEWEWSLNGDYCWPARLYKPSDIACEA